MPGRSKFGIAVVLLLAGWTPLSPGLGAADDPLGDLVRKVFDLANRERLSHGVRKLEWNDALAEQARRHSMNMMYSGSFSHKDPSGATLAMRLRAAGIRWGRCGENIFRERGMEDPAAAAVEGWMKSPSHRQSLLDPLFAQSGVGIAISPDTEYFITQDFISSAKVTKVSILQNPPWSAADSRRRRHLRRLANACLPRSYLPKSI